MAHAEMRLGIGAAGFPVTANCIMCCDTNKILFSKTQYLCITSDGWSNIANEAVVNNMAVLPSHSLFVESVNTAEQGHNAGWIAEDLQRVIDSLECNVTGAVTDNIQERMPIRFFHGCVSHGLHLIVKDIFAATKRKPPGGGAGEPPVYRDGYPFEHLLHFANAC